MDVRKVQLTGGSSYTVTLPKAWVVAAKLSPGDSVGFVPLADGGISLYPRAAVPQGRSRYELVVGDEDAAAIFRRLVAAYLAGHDTIVVKGKKTLSAQARRAVRSGVKRIIGLEIVEEDPRAIVLQDFLDPREFHIEKGLRRMEAICRSMQEEAIRALTPGEGAPAEVDLDERDDEVDRLYWMINKQYHAILRDPAYGARLGVGASEALNVLLVARVVERTADHARRIERNARELRGGAALHKLEAKMERQARRSADLFASSLDAFHRRDAAAGNRLIDEAQAFERAQDAIIGDSLTLGGENIVHVAYALESIARTAAYAADVAEIAINHEVAGRSR